MFTALRTVCSLPLASKLALVFYQSFPLIFHRMNYAQNIVARVLCQVVKIYASNRIHIVSQIHCANL